MSPVSRQCIHGPVSIDMGLLWAIEAAVGIDEAPPPSVIAPLVARVDIELDACRNPEDNDQLVSDALAAMDGCWLRLEEVHAVQRLRGWHRQQYGRITVDAYWLADTRNVLDGMTLSLGSECDEELAQAEYDPDLQAQIAARMKADRGCGECTWCRCLDLRDQCDAILDKAGYDGGSRYRAYALNQTAEQIDAYYGRAS